jgi:putative transposase
MTHPPSATGCGRCGLTDLRDDRASMPVPNSVGVVVGQAPVSIAVVSDNGPCFRSEAFAQVSTGPDPLLRHVCTWVRSPRTNGVVERFFGTLKYEHLYRAMIRDSDVR